MIFEELPFKGTRTPPKSVKLLRTFGFVAMGVALVSVIGTDPKPALSGDGLIVSLALVVYLAGLAFSVSRQTLPPGVRFGGLVATAVASCVLLAVQPDSAGYVGIYYVVVISGLRLRPQVGLPLAGATLAVQIVTMAIVEKDPYGSALGLFFSIVPWMLMIRLMRTLQQERAQAEELVEELRESRAAQLASAAEAERSRVARDLHDVLAHSLSALALQLEGARLMARDRDTDPSVVDAVERAHHLAAAGLTEAREAIAALRGDDLPGPERLRELCEAFGSRCTLTVTGEPRELGSEARLAIYRTAQEALTNVRKHSAADHVEVRLDSDGDGTTLTVQDHGPGAPVIVGSSGGYGLTGMRERAELVGGRLTAEPTDDGFRVELWLP
jgi:signal transduction histidine kinase